MVTGGGEEARFNLRSWKKILRVSGGYYHRSSCIDEYQSNSLFLRRCVKLLNSVLPRDLIFQIIREIDVGVI